MGYVLCSFGRPSPSAGLIQQLPISRLQAKDRVIWRLSPNGVYLAKSGYQAIVNLGSTTCVLA